MKSSIRTLILLNALCLVCAGVIASAEDASNSTMSATTATESVTNTALSATNATMAISIRDSIARALQNNFDIKIQRLNPSISSWGVVSAQGIYDPTLSGSASYRDSTAPTDPQTQRSLGLSALAQQSLSSQLGLGGKLPTGATYNFSAADTRASGTLNSNFVFTGTSALSLTQPILRNFGLGVNAATIRIARKSRDIAVQNFLLQMINSVTAVENAYYELVFAIEDHKAKLDDLTLAKQLLDETRRKVQIGVSSPLDVTTAESGVASRNESVILAERTIKDNENALKLLISQNVSEFRGVSLAPVDYPIVEMVQTDVDRSIRTALEKRPEYISARLSVERQNIQVKFNRNQLWPEIDLNASYGWAGRSDTFDGWVSSSLGERESPVWSGGLTMSIPLGNRQARATYQASRLAATQLLLQLKQLEQQIVVAVDNAAGHVETNLKSVEAAAAARRLAEESYQAERTKLQAGTSTTLNVLTQESALADARSREIRARASYSESLVALAQAEGTTLERHNIVLNERF